VCSEIEIVLRWRGCIDGIQNGVTCDTDSETHLERGRIAMVFLYFHLAASIDILSATVIDLNYRSQYMSVSCCK
jgi:hypothetical protein